MAKKKRAWLEADTARLMALLDDIEGRFEWAGDQEKRDLEAAAAAIHRTAKLLSAAAAAEDKPRSPRKRRRGGP